MNEQIKPDLVLSFLGGASLRAHSDETTFTFSLEDGETGKTSVFTISQNEAQKLILWLQS